MMTQWELEQNPYLHAILGVRLRAAGDFSAEHMGVRGEAYDRAVLDCLAAVQAVVEALAIEAAQNMSGPSHE